MNYHKTKIQQQDDRNLLPHLRETIMGSQPSQNTLLRARLARRYRRAPLPVSHPLIHHLHLHLHPSQRG